MITRYDLEHDNPAVQAQTEEPHHSSTFLFPLATAHPHRLTENRINQLPAYHHP